jgi:hypothetical protein
MASAPTPYVPAHPGDLITAEGWNSMQLQAKQDIATQIAAAIAGVKTVDHANDADTLSHQNLDAITKYILDQVYAQLPKRTGYMQYFCNLHLGADPSKIIKHGLKAYPLVDVYQLEYFPAVCAKDDTQADETFEWVLFYLYHGDERRVRGVDIETDDPKLRSNPPFRVLWKTLIDQLVENKQLEYTDDTTLDDLELDFWKAMFADPNGRFDPDATCHSPWFEKCCGEKRSVADLRKHGDFDDIWLKLKPVKTVNWSGTAVQGRDNVVAPVEPSNVRVAHLDMDTLMVQLLDPVTYVLPAMVGGVTITQPQPADFTNYLPVMLLLKV